MSITLHQTITSELVEGSDIQEIKLKGHWPNSAAKKTAEQIAGGWFGKRLVVFIDGEARSNGESTIFRVNMNSFNGVSDFELSSRWRPSKPLTPGQIITIGMIQSREPETVSFTVDRADFTPPDSRPVDSK